MSLFRPTKAQSIVSPFLAMRPATVNWFESLAAPLPLHFHCSSFSLRIFILSASDILGSTSTLDFCWNIQTLSALCLFVCVFECKSVKAYTLINCVHKSRHTWKLGAVTMREKKALHQENRDSDEGEGRRVKHSYRQILLCQRVRKI